ncbi:MAG: hypothetical protein ABIP79_13940 [Chitinophagaceae bacterium]
MLINLVLPIHRKNYHIHAILFLKSGNYEFGDNYRYTDNTFNFLGLSARSYNSFNAAANEAGLSRFYAGIHYLPSLRAGAIKGSRIAT